MYNVSPVIKFQDYWRVFSLKVLYSPFILFLVLFSFHIILALLWAQFCFGLASYSTHVSHYAK